MLRSCNITESFVYAEDGTPIPVRWYITDPDAPPLGFPSAFLHPIWEEHYHNEFEGPGCLLRGAQWVPNKLDTPRTYQVLGKIDWWQNGLPADFDPLDEACGSELLGATGGALVGGSGWAGGPTEAARACGCGQPSSSVWASVITAEACGCGQASSLVGSHVHTSTVCGCGAAMVGCFEFDCLSTVCGCGQPSSHRPGFAPMLALACGCGGPSSTVHAGIMVPCSTFPVPTSLVFTVVDRGGCSCLAGSYSINFNGSVWLSNFMTLCGVPNSQVGMSCIAQPINWYGTISGIGSGNVPLTVLSQSPVHLEATGIHIATGCSGVIDIEVTQ